MATFIFLLVVLSINSSIGVTPVMADTNKTSLRLEIISSKGAKKNWTLKCAPTGGSHPNKIKACNFLLSKNGEKALFSKKSESCTQIFGGSATASIIGRYESRQIKLLLDRRDGCSIETWNKLMLVLRAK
jgi:hypothetical protein